jgi:beta-lactamase superfamily II metal-dependent hydrolase
MKRGLILVVRVLLLAVSCCTTTTAQTGSVRVQIIDRGQADGILIRTPNQRWVVLDAGQDSLQAKSMQEIWGVDRVALAILSHLHRDHLGGLEDILRLFPVDLYLGSGRDCPNRILDDRLRNLIHSQGISVLPTSPGPVEIDGVRFIVLPQDPVENPCPGDENNNSLVVRMEYGQFSMLFVGDAETEERQWLMQNHPDLLDVDVLKAAHHGSWNGVDGSVNGQSWLGFVTPKAVVISAHINSKYHHPDPEAVNAYEEAVGHNRVYCTSRQGTIRVYGRQDGSFTVRRQTPYSGSCKFGSP